ncbi:MAG TPA: MFS transporter [Aldersonia sp.]
MNNTMRTRQIPRPAASWVVAAAFLVMMCGAAAPSPLYSVYQQQWGFSAITLTTVFAVYVLALLSSLLTVGALSDHIGRRPVLFAALIVLAASMLVFIAAQSVAWLVAARVLQGLATGAATGAFTATIVDLQRHEQRGPLINSLAPTIGLAVGALGSGLLVQFAPAPTTLVYVVLAVGYLLSAAMVVAIPETSPASGFATRAQLLAALRPSVAVPSTVRTRVATIVPCLIASWSLGGLYLSLSPSITATVFGLHNHVVGGAEIATLFGFGALGAALTRNQKPASVMSRGAWRSPAAAA